MRIDFEDWKSELLAKIDTGLRYGSSLGADGVEIYLSKTHSLRMNFNSGLIDVKQGGSIGVGCRCLSNNKIGFASASGISDSEIKFAVINALDVAKVSQIDSRWVSFVQNPEIGKEGIIDTALLELSPEEVTKNTLAIYDEAKKYDSRISAVFIDTDVSYGVIAVGNTEGIAKASASSSFEIETYITASDKGKTKSSYGFKYGRKVPHLEGEGTSVATKAINQLKSKPLNHTGQMKVVLDNSATGFLLQTALSNSINGKSVVEGRSAFADKMKEQVGVSFLNIYDDGQLLEHPKTYSIDAEGFPRRKTPIIENGVLQNYIFDNYYSNIIGSKNTGNAIREGTQSYESLPEIALNPFSVDPGSKDLKGLVAEIENGILINVYMMGLHTANPISGEFSVVAPYVYKIEHGEITTPLESITVAGNLYKIFNQILAVGNDTDITYGGKNPSMAFEGFSISG